MENNLDEQAEASIGKKKAVLALFIDIVLNLAVIIILVVLIRTYLVSPFKIYGPSMCDSFNYIDNECKRGNGEIIMLNKASYRNFFGFQVGLPERFDVIVFNPPKNDETSFIKRIIGLPGETVKLKDGKVYIYNQDFPEGFELKENYLNESNKNNTYPYREEDQVFEVPANSYIVFGDNRTGSSDSRSCFKEGFSNDNCGENGVTPFLSFDRIEGRAWLVIWPISNMKVVKTNGE